MSDKTMDFSAGMSAIMATCTSTYDGNEYTTDNNVSTPFNISAAFSIYDNLSAGISLYTPYGSSINWGKNWPGAVLNQSVDLKVFTVQPTVSWRIIPGLSVGAGLMISWGNV
ncbi:MAG: outer membrane protein transport protein, partial [Paramuribaculum sp.]|nr:outer membrane protein transport protein [Paramuribaculum sp.]